MPLNLMEYHQQIKICLEVLSCEKFSANISICQKMQDSLNQYPTRHLFMYKVVSPLIKTWPYFSGDINYPVPAPNGFFTPDGEERSLEEYCFDNLPLWVGEYGAVRRDLLQHIIKSLEKILATVEA